MIRRILRALSTLAELATLARRVTEIDRRLAVETRARTEDTVWLRRELRLHLPTVGLPAPCYTCGATHGREIARVSRPVWDSNAKASVHCWRRVLRCVGCGLCQDVPVDGVSTQVTQERPS